MCPHCRSLERHRLVWPIIKRHVRDDSRVLHFAPEPAFYARLVRLPGYVAADLDPDGRGLPQIERIDITSQPFADESFDVAIVSHVLEHVPDDHAAIRELHRVLAAGGVAITQHPWNPALQETIETPIASPLERERLYGQADHVRRYGRDLLGRFRAAGFDVEHLQARKGLGPGNDVLVCTKAGHQSRRWSRA